MEQHDSVNFACFQPSSLERNGKWDIFPSMPHSTSDGENADLGLDAPKLIQQNYKRLRWWKEILAVIVTKLSERECVWVCVKREREWVWVCVKERERERVYVWVCEKERECVCVCMIAFAQLWVQVCVRCESKCAWDFLLEQLTPKRCLAHQKSISLLKYLDLRTENIYYCYCLLEKNWLNICKHFLILWYK